MAAVRMKRMAVATVTKRHDRAAFLQTSRSCSTMITTKYKTKNHLTKAGKSLL